MVISLCIGSNKENMMKLSVLSFKDLTTVVLRLIVKSVILTSTDLSFLDFFSLPVVVSADPKKPVSPLLRGKSEAYSGWQTTYSG